ncbi:hypothetical protein [Clostridium sp.]|uniref:hypothetical protein n=1 Tax=Clostridium sp. TaxID=1506 RepID=UPI002FC9F163
MRKQENIVHIEGRINELDLAVKVSKKGVTYIGGKIHIATDDKMLNIVTVDYSYVVPTFNSGKENKNYAVLTGLMSNAKTLMGNPGEEATMVRVDSSIGLNEWYKDGKNEKGEAAKELVSTKIISGGFIHVATELNPDESKRCTFNCDMVINATRFIEGIEEKETVDKLIVSGAIFNFNNALLPVEFTITNPKGIEHFQNLAATKSNIVYTKVWGKIVNETIVTKITEESAFGEDSVREIVKSKRDWVSTGTSTVPAEFDVDGILTAKELQEATAARQIYLATKLQEQLAREAEKAKNNNAFTAPVTTGGFAF